MFHYTRRKNAEKTLKTTKSNYDATYNKLIEGIQELYDERTLSVETIKDVEAFVNSLKNTPDELNKKMASVRIDIERFEKGISDLKINLKNGNHKVNSTAISGLIAAVGAGALGPSAAMAVATTFGTASTGTAIATLHGAIATKAALARLGGGALSAGGGVAAGTALLSMAGPVGWGIAALSIIGAGRLKSKENKKYAKKAMELAESMTKEIIHMKALEISVNALFKRTVALRIAILELHEKLKSVKIDEIFGKAIKSENLNDEEVAIIAELGKLVNLTKTLSVLITEEVEDA